MSAPQKMKLPFFDVSRQYQPLKSQVLEKFTQILDRQAFIGGDVVSQFETDLAKWTGAKHAITVANGTDSLTLALRALDIGHGDEVITTPYSFFASTGSILLTGAKPVFVDIDPRTYNINPALIEKAITSKTKAILPVHLYGQCADMDPILAVAKKHKLFVVEDYAQSIGAADKGRQAGTMGTVGCTSFYPTKNLGGAGEGGAITTNDDKLAEKIKMIRSHGMPKRYIHDVLGTNSRMNALQVSYIAVKLPLLKNYMASRQKIAARYAEELRPLTDKGLVLPFTSEGNTHVWNQFIVRVPKRDEVQKALAEEGIPTEIYYPMTIPEQKVLRGICQEKGWSESESAARTSLALPVFPELTAEEQGFVISALQKVFKSI